MIQLNYQKESFNVIHPSDGAPFHSLLFLCGSEDHYKRPWRLFIETRHNTPLTAAEHGLDE